MRLPANFFRTIYHTTALKPEDYLRERRHKVQRTAGQSSHQMTYRWDPWPADGARTKTILRRRCPKELSLSLLRFQEGQRRRRAEAPGRGTASHSEQTSTPRGGGVPPFAKKRCKTTPNEEPCALWLPCHETYDLGSNSEHEHVT